MIVLPKPKLGEITISGRSKKSTRMMCGGRQAQHVEHDGPIVIRNIRMRSPMTTNRMTRSHKTQPNRKGQSGPASMKYAGTDASRTLSTNGPLGSS
jgi:hypothetical protein